MMRNICKKQTTWLQFILLFALKTQGFRVEYSQSLFFNEESKMNINGMDTHVEVK